MLGVGPDVSVVQLPERIVPRSPLTVSCAILGAALALGLAGCGKRGPLEPPPGYEAADKARKDRDRQKALEEAARTDPQKPTLLRSTATGEPDAAPPDQKPKPLAPQPFFLDDIL